MAASGEVQLFQKVELLNRMHNMQGAQMLHGPVSPLPIDMTNVIFHPWHLSCCTSKKLHIL